VSFEGKDWGWGVIQSLFENGSKKLSKQRDVVSIGVNSCDKYIIEVLIEVISNEDEANIDESLGFTTVKNKPEMTLANVSLDAVTNLSSVR
jgi:hypothetical protein